MVSTKIQFQYCGDANTRLDYGHKKSGVSTLPFFRCTVFRSPLYSIYLSIGLKAGLLNTWIGSSSNTSSMGLDMVF